MNSKDSCIFCKHIRWEQSTPAWSELTPGDPEIFECVKKHWDLVKNHDGDTTLMRKALTMSKDCPDFEESK